MKTNDLEAKIFCGEVYLFREERDRWVLERHAGAVSISYLKLPGENRTGFNKRLRASEKEIETKHCMDCTESLCKTTNSVCRLYEKNKYLTESEDSDG